MTKKKFNNQRIKIRSTLLVLLSFGFTILSFAQTLSVKINPDLSLNYNAYVSFEVVLENDGNVLKSTSSKKRKHRIKWSDIDITLNGADYLKRGLFKIHSGNTLNEEGSITIDVAYGNLSVSKTIELKFDDILIVNFNGKNAKKRKQNSIFGSLGRAFFNGILTEVTGVETTPSPRKGKSGNKGGHAGMVVVNLDTIHINQQVILKATCEDKTHHRQAVAYVNPKLGEIKIMAEGGKGSNGTPGEAYSPEKHGPSYDEGASGGNGGRAGAGGFVEVYTDKSTNPYLNAIIVSTTGGFGGVRGRSGGRNNTATNGSNGSYGNVVFVTKDSLPTKEIIPSQKMK